MHPLYQRAQGLVGQPVHVHAYDRVHHGVLHSLTADGIYLRPMNGAGMASHDTTGMSTPDLIQTPLSGQSVDAEQVFWPLLFLPFLAIWALGPWWWW